MVSLIYGQCPLQKTRKTVTLKVTLIKYLNYKCYIHFVCQSDFIYFFFFLFFSEASNWGLLVYRINKFVVQRIHCKLNIYLVVLSVCLHVLYYLNPEHTKSCFSWQWILYTECSVDMLYTEYSALQYLRNTFNEEPGLLIERGLLLLMAIVQNSMCFLNTGE